MARRPRKAPIAPVTWRDGVHLTGTPIWCDARRRRDVCFVSSADRIGRAGHGQLIGTPITLALIAARDSGHLAVPIHRPFTLGTMRVELIPSGRGLGAAALHVDAGDHTVLYAGAIRTVNPTEAAEVRASDAVVVAAPFGEAHHRFPPVDTVADMLMTWLRVQRTAGKPTTLVVDSVLDGLEVATKLVAEGFVVAGSRTLRDAVLRVGALASMPAIQAPGREPAVLIRLETERIKPYVAQAFVPDPMTALVSGRALDPQPTWDAGFAWPFVAGRDQLLAWIEQARAKEIFVTGSGAEAIVATLGARARVLGPPHQMALFAP